LNNIREGPHDSSHDKPHETIVTDVHIVAFLRFHQWSYRMKRNGDRVQFVFPGDALNDVGRYYDDENNAVPVMEYVELLKSVKNDLYQKKSERKKSHEV